VAVCVYGSELYIKACIHVICACIVMFVAPTQSLSTISTFTTSALSTSSLSSRSSTVVDKGIHSDNTLKHYLSIFILRHIGRA